MVGLSRGKGKSGKEVGDVGNDRFMEGYIKEELGSGDQI